MSFYLFYILLISYKIIICSKCIEGQNFCKMCNPVTKLCAICDNNNVLKPDENGGCEGIKKCEIGKNYCSECQNNEILCLTCEEGYFPDENGGCSYANNCEISNEGICIKCKTDFILIGQNTYNNIYDNIKICKYNKSEEFKNCEFINKEKGLCQQCSQGYYLTGKDRKCTKVQNCAESKFGICKFCNIGYYLDKSQEKCIQQKDSFLHCKITLDGENCDTCMDNYYFDEKGECISNNFCLSEKDYFCEKCVSGFFLSESYECTQEKNCKVGKKDLGICALCNDNYYIDYKDGKCKSNLEDNDFKFCKIADDDMCSKCIEGYYLAKDYKCTPSQNCLEADKGKCLICENNYYLGLDNICNSVDHCIYSNSQGQCIECEDNYYYDTDNITCKISDEKFMNCKSGIEKIYCNICKNNFYINKTDHLCYSNLNNDKFYKCSATDFKGELCVSCVEGYYLGSKDFLCTTIEGCEISENLNKCLKCDSNFYCLDKKLGKCENNYKIEKEENKIYYKCNMTNDDGTKCQKCVEEDKYILNNEGICIDDKHCIEKKDGICQKCLNERFDSYCLNNIFGCMHSFYENCLECNDILNFNRCTKCHEGYELNKYSICIKISN